MATAKTLKYPRVPRGPVVEDHFGTSVPDPYRWLEDPESEETKAFVNAQNEVSGQFLDTKVRHEAFGALQKFQNFPKFSTPFKRGSFWYSWRNAGLQNQSVLHRHQVKNGEESQIFLDPNAWTEDGTAAIGSVKFTSSGSLMAYSRGDAGSDWRTIYFVDTVSGKHLEDKLLNAKFTSLEWAGENRFFYNRYDVPEGKDANGVETTKSEFQKLYCHELNTPQAKDVLMLEFPDEPNWLSEVQVTDDQKFLVAKISRSCEPACQLWIARLPDSADPAEAYGSLEWIKVDETFESLYEYVANDGPVFLFTTNRNAPRNKIIRVDITQPGFLMEDVVPEARAVLEEALAFAGDKMMLHYTEDVKSRLYVHRMDGSLLKAVDIPVGTAYDFSGERKHDHFLFSVTSFNSPRVIYDLNMEGDSFGAVVLRRIEVKGLPLELLEVTQEFYRSKDATEIPMFLMRKKGWEGQGPRPTLLYGYGGFNISLMPYFSVFLAVCTLYLGLNVAIPNIRGGGEYGLDWYKAAIKATKQVSYDDFQAAAEYLIKKRYTDASMLAIAGGSNGGLLVAACANQRPDLFKAVVANVGVMDLLRFHKFTIGHAWMSDYGDPDKEEDFKHIYKISPLHNIQPSVVRSAQQPAVLVLTGDHDDRVSPLHSLKYIAELQHAAGYSSPVTTPLIAHIETKAGHGGGKPLLKVLEEQADKCGFLATVLGLQWEDPTAPAEAPTGDAFLKK